METFIEYYILNIVIWGLFLRWQLFIKQDIRNDMIKRLEMTPEDVDKALFKNWIVLTLFWWFTIIMVVVYTIKMKWDNR
ncbi:MAG: hypothetical protein CMP21_03570 [Rickettsiales bacterium]|nr:hypothetical protein [Rickettsiales bacterium]|tara:strand:+ start:15556 stop:15792 length:237 start_codon:yes stop_codon:yes gene_type:complete